MHSISPIPLIFRDTSTRPRVYQLRDKYAVTDITCSLGRVVPVLWAVRAASWFDYADDSTKQLFVSLFPLMTWSFLSVKAVCPFFPCSCCRLTYVDGLVASHCRTFHPISPSLPCFLIKWMGGNHAYSIWRHTNFSRYTSLVRPLKVQLHFYVYKARV